MEASIKKMANKILKEASIPQQWNRMKIKSIIKNKGSRKELKNRRGLFLTSIPSKVFERILMNGTKNMIKIDEHQLGGRKGRSTKDNLIVMMAILERNRELNVNTYMVFADAMKCFDKLWLKDCLVDMESSGMREREVKILYELNRKAEIVIETPSGETSQIEVTDIVKQGTIFGPQLCCFNTVKVNEVTATPVTMISPEIAVSGLVYMDDIMAAGSKETIGTFLQNMGKLACFSCLGCYG